MVMHVLISHDQNDFYHWGGIIVRTTSTSLAWAKVKRKIHSFPILHHLFTTIVKKITFLLSLLRPKGSLSQLLMTRFPRLLKISLL